MNTFPSNLFLRVLRVFAVSIFISLLMGCAPEKPHTYPVDQLTVEHTFPTNSLHIGDQVELLVTAYYPTNGVLTVPELGLKKEIVQLNRNWHTEVTEQGMRKTDIRYTLTSFRLGEHPIITSNLVCTVADQTLEQPFPPANLKVISILTDDDDSNLADIKPMAKLPRRIPRWLWLIPLTALLAFLIGLIIAKTYKAKPTIKRGPPPLPPHIIALQALAGLKAKNLLEQNECAPFYTELSQILRTYLEGRFLLHAPESTTEEIVADMSKSPELNGTQRNILQDFMRQADMVKFAKDHPDATTMERAYDTTEQFVNETKQNEI